MADDGETKDDVKVPDGEVGEKIDKLFTVDEKDTSKFTYPGRTAIPRTQLTNPLSLRRHCPYCHG